MKRTYVSRSIAEILKTGLNFTEETVKYYAEDKGDTLFNCSRNKPENNNNPVFKTYSAPSLDDLRNWFRDVHKIEIAIELDYFKDDLKQPYYVLHGVFHIPTGKNFKIGSRPTYDSYDEALEQGLRQAVSVYFFCLKEK